jgi:hypothetical protein
MNASELATIILVLCGKGEGDYTLDCRDHMVNCAVDSQGNIEKKKVAECIEQQKGK